MRKHRIRAGHHHAARPAVRTAEERQQIKAALGDLARVRGLRNEEQAVHAMQARRKLWPAWLLSVRAATPDEDAKGWDVIAETLDLGTIGIQVKSSRSGARAFEREHPRIPVAVIGQNNEGRAFLAVLDALKEARRRFLRETDHGEDRTS